MGPGQRGGSSGSGPADSSRTRRQGGGQLASHVRDRGLGGRWPESARRVAGSHSVAHHDFEASVRIQLLSDIRSILEPEPEFGSWVASEDIANGLAAFQEGQWAEWNRGKPISKAQIAKLLSRVGLGPRMQRIADKTLSDYSADA